MIYRNFLYILLFFFLNNCSSDTLLKKKISTKLDINYINRGFALIYSDDLYNEKIITKKIDERSLIIFQRNLKKNTPVKITNILNSKSIIAKVGTSSLYPSFNNSVLSSRIASELELDINEPYVEVLSFSGSSIFVAGRAKTFNEEREVANKAPIETININDLNKKKKPKDNKKIIKKKFKYSIKVADFYFDTSAYAMAKKIEQKTTAKKVKVQKISKTKYRVYFGPFFDINSLQNTFNDINILGFENIEIIKND